MEARTTSAVTLVSRCCLSADECLSLGGSVDHASYLSLCSVGGISVDTWDCCSLGVTATSNYCDGAICCSAYYHHSYTSPCSHRNIGSEGATASAKWECDHCEPPVDVTVNEMVNLIADVLEKESDAEKLRKPHMKKGGACEEQMENQIEKSYRKVEKTVKGSLTPNSSTERISKPLESHWHPRSEYFTRHGCYGVWKEGFDSSYYASYPGVRSKSSLRIVSVADDVVYRGKNFTSREDVAIHAGKTDGRSSRSYKNSVCHKRDGIRLKCNEKRGESPREDSSDKIADLKSHIEWGSITKKADDIDVAGIWGSAADSTPSSKTSSMITADKMQGPPACNVNLEENTREHSLQEEQIFLLQMEPGRYSKRLPDTSRRCEYDTEMDCESLFRTSGTRESAENASCTDSDSECKARVAENSAASALDNASGLSQQHGRFDENASTQMDSTDQRQMFTDESVVIDADYKWSTSSERLFQMGEDHTGLVCKGGANSFQVGALNEPKSRFQNVSVLSDNHDNLVKRPDGTHLEAVIGKKPEEMTFCGSNGGENRNGGLHGDKLSSIRDKSSGFQGLSETSELHESCLKRASIIKIARALIDSQVQNSASELNVAAEEGDNYINTHNKMDRGGQSLSRFSILDDGHKRSSYPRQVALTFTGVNIREKDEISKKQAEIVAKEDIVDAANCMEDKNMPELQSVSADCKTCLRCLKCSSSEYHAAAGLSDEIWVEPSIIPEEASIPKVQGEVVKSFSVYDVGCFFKRTSKHMWAYIIDVIRGGWGLNVQPNSLLMKPTAKSLSNEFVSSAQWFSGDKLMSCTDGITKSCRRGTGTYLPFVPLRDKLQASNIFCHNHERYQNTSMTGKMTHVEDKVVTPSNIMVCRDLNPAYFGEQIAGSRRATNKTGIMKASSSLPLTGTDCEPKETSSIAVSRGSLLSTGHLTDFTQNEEASIVVKTNPRRADINEIPHTFNKENQVVGIIKGKDVELKQGKFQESERSSGISLDEGGNTMNLELEQIKVDEKFMREALVEARKAADYWEVPIGAVLVQDGKIIAQGCNMVETLRDSTAHAEIICIREASHLLRSWRLAETTLYVTCEPCPMCAGAILQARIDTLVWGAPNKLVGADGSWISLFSVFKNGTDVLNPSHLVAPVHPLHPKMVVRRGVLATECEDAMHQPFKRRKRNIKLSQTPACHPLSGPSKFLSKINDIFWNVALFVQGRG